MKIKRLQLYCAHLKKQKHFYLQTLGLALIEERANFFSVAVGESILCFEERESFQAYHFALNLYNNHFEQAYQWAKEHLGLLKEGGTEIHDFSNWNAEALYFKDADGNILEFICRYDLKCNSDKEFTPSQLLSISEIGLVSPQIAVQHAMLSKLNIPVYSGSPDRFCAMGGDEALFILINPEKKSTWFPTTTKANVVDFTIEIEQGKTNHQLQYSQGHLSLTQ